LNYQEDQKDIMANKKYWKSFGELNNSEAYQKSVQDEFQEDLLPLEDVEKEGLLDAKTPRRDFLKYLGFSTAAATLAASCEIPVRHSVPLMQKPDDMIPGISNWYASTYVNGGEAVPVLVKQREGRPIKIEGNPDSVITGGGTSAQLQASVLDLYDTSRLRHPLVNGKEATHETVDKMVMAAMGQLGGKPLVLLTSTLTSPSTRQLISEFLGRFPGSRHVQYDAVSASGMLIANQASYGRRVLPSFRFDKAKVIVSLGADFLGRWLNPVEYNYLYAQTRRINSAQPTMSRHIQFESFLSLTGSNADERYLHKPSEEGAVAVALLNAINGTGSSLPGKLGEGVRKTAAELLANRGAGLVVSGSNDANVQLIVNAINNTIGANGTTIDWSVTNNSRQGIDAEMVQLVNDMNNGLIGGLFIYDANPSYTYFDAARFNAGVKKVGVTVSFNEKVDETSELCKFQIPSPHWLESWGDAEPKSGHISLIQPVIHPLFKTRPFQTSLLKWSNVTVDYDSYFRNYWTGKFGGVDQFHAAIQKGVSEPGADAGVLTTATGAAGGGVFIGNVADATGRISAQKSGATEFILYENIAMGTGKQANNPWLLELPDPITKATWDNYVMISPAMAKELLDIDIFNSRESDRYEVNPDKPVLSITANGKTIELPALIIPGMHPNVIAMAVGYGRKSGNPDRTAELLGAAVVDAGVNVYHLGTFNGTGVSNYGTATVAVANREYEIAQTQVHNVTEGRPVVRETTLKEFIADPGHVLREEKAELAMYGKDFVQDATLYPHFDKPGAKWGMSIDLNTCTGCSACVIACHVENNVPVVGKHEVTRYHDMHWLRIDRYFTGDKENPDVVFQPMLCQHCDNAPCENVCPVSATNHSSEGINQMAYNRCIGTRYCANNCPYKVRRFNWADYMGTDSFPDNQRGIVSDATMMMNDELTRMVLNPDVTVRSRGVMEKCTFCVQRTQEGKLNAKKENRVIVDADVQTACAQACPTDAIVFGNVNDKNSAIYKLRETEQKDRKFYVLENLHTLSNVNYLVKVRNTDRVVGDIHEEHQAPGEGGKEAAGKH
jgi:MoCo/4Fe-4S cofactor protein with predicted Tat translocation signal